MNYISNKKILSFYELSKWINESKCILNDDILDYFESLLSLNVSVLYKDGIDNITADYLNELQLFRNLVLYNIYYKSLKLVDDNGKYLVCNDMFNRLNVNVSIQNISYNIFSIDYKNTTPNICFYDSNSINLSKLNNDYFINNYENICLLSSERNQILLKFLSQNNLNMSDFIEERNKNNRQKVLKYGFANVIIK